MILLVWCILHVLVLLPTALILQSRRYQLLPFFLYGASLWLFLVLGMPFLREPYGSSNWEMVYGVAIGIAAFPLWFMLILGSLPSQKEEQKGVFFAVQKTSSNRSDILVFVGVWLVAFMGVAVYLKTAGVTPLVEVVSAGASKVLRDSEMMDIRKSATYVKSFGIYKQFFYTLPLFAGTLGHVLFRFGRINKLVHIGSICLVVVLTVQFLHKSFPVIFAFQLLLVEMYFVRLSFRKLFFITGIACSFLIGAYLFNAGYINVLVIESLVRRISVAYVRSLEFALSNWPMPYDFFGGTTFPNPRGIFPFEPVNLSGFVMGEMRDKIGNAPVPAIGGGYVNFGYLGIPFVACLITFWLLVLVTSFKFLRRSPVGLSLWVMMALNVINFSRNEFFGGIDLRFLFLATLILILRFVLNSDWIGSSLRMYPTQRNARILYESSHSS